MRITLVASLAVGIATFVDIHGVRAASVAWMPVEALNRDALDGVHNLFGQVNGGRFDYSRDGLIDLEDLNIVRNRSFDEPIERPTAIVPSLPRSTDVISFYLDFGYGSNDCEASVAAGGTPYLFIDEMARIVVVALDPFDVGVICGAEYEPVHGLAGDFGPLPSGTWRFSVAGQPLAVLILVSSGAAVPEIGGASLALVSCAVWSAFFLARSWVVLGPGRP